MSYRIGIDVGGTFTDFVAASGKALIRHKVSSTPDDPAQAVLHGLAGIGEREGMSLSGFLGLTDVIVHGTTVATNALLTRSGAKTGLLTTRGFRDVLPMRDGTREAPYDNRLQPPEPLVPRFLTCGIAGRIDVLGEEVESLSEGDVRAAARLFRHEGVEAVAVSFLHAATNGVHERQAAEWLRDELPDAYLTGGSELLPQVRYYDRTSTAVLNSYVGPKVSGYLERLTDGLASAGFEGALLIMQSNGGVAAPGEVARHAAQALLSGPAAAPTAGLAAVAPQGNKDCLTIDMGGTSFDVSVVRDGVPLVRTDATIARWRLGLPIIDIHTIGAGGGSVAWVDRAGLLRVGPESAGAEPGPACYGRGGSLPTVTDADLVLGYVGSSLAGDEVKLDHDAAVRAIEEHVAQRLGIGVVEAAAGIFEVVNVAMATGVRDVTVRRGIDPRDFPLVVAGGAGPLHGLAIAEELQIPRVVVHRDSPVLCALGMLLCDLKHDFAQPIGRRLKALDLDALRAGYEALCREATTVLEGEGAEKTSTRLRASLEMRYAGQWWELNVPLDGSPANWAIAEIEQHFHQAHDRHFGFSSSGSPIDVLTLRLSAIGVSPKPEDAAAAAAGTDEPVGQQPIWSRKARAFVDALVYEGARLPIGARVAGPALVRFPATTIVALEAHELHVDSSGSFVIEWQNRMSDTSPSGLDDLAVKSA